MVEIRCKKCGKLLGKFEGTGEVKCPRTNCAGKNIFDTKAGTNKYVPPEKHIPLRDRATSSGVTFH